MGRLRIFFLISFLFLIYPQAGLAARQEDRVGERFKGEVLKYDIRFWILGRVGEGEAVFKSLGQGKYQADHEARTVGIAGWVSRYRRDVYRSTMGTINEGRRLIPLRFEEDVIIGKASRKRVTSFDYPRRKILIENRQSGKMTREEVDIPFGVLYDDPMTAFYNFRAGVYGKVEPGRKIIIHTTPLQGKPRNIRLNVAPRDVAAKKRAAESDPDDKDIYLTVHMDKEMVGSLHGLVYAWFTRDVVPVSGVAKDVIFWGDITGQVTYHGFGPPPGGQLLSGEFSRPELKSGKK